MNYWQGGGEEKLYPLYQINALANSGELDIPFPGCKGGGGLHADDAPILYTGDAPFRATEGDGHGATFEVGEAGGLAGHRRAESRSSYERDEKDGCNLEHDYRVPKISGKVRCDAPFIYSPGCSGKLQGAGQ